MVVETTSGLQFVEGSLWGASAPNQTYLEVTTSGFTLEFWASLPTAGADGYRHLVTKATTPAVGWQVLYYDAHPSTSPNHLNSFRLGATDMSAGIIPSTGSHHLAWTYDGANIKYWLDGSLTATTALVDATTSTVSALTIGSKGATYNEALNYGNFTIDELRISQSVRYTGAFTPGSAQFASDGSTAGLYHFNTGSMNDSSANANNGTTNAFWTTGYILSGFPAAVAVASSPIMQASKFWGPI